MYRELRFSSVVVLAGLWAPTCSEPPGGGSGGSTGTPGVWCGSGRCPSGQVCCNASCGICTPPRGVCTQQVCEPDECETDADCRTFSDYCTGCDCRALPVDAPDPVCPGPGVQCFVDPCMGGGAVCSSGRCQLADR
jgi:hypothetical protein